MDWPAWLEPTDLVSNQELAIREDGEVRGSRSVQILGPHGLVGEVIVPEPRRSGRIIGPTPGRWIGRDGVESDVVVLSQPVRRDHSRGAPGDSNSRTRLQEWRIQAHLLSRDPGLNIGDRVNGALEAAGHPGMVPVVLAAWVGPGGTGFHLHTASATVPGRPLAELIRDGQVPTPDLAYAIGLSAIDLYLALTAADVRHFDVSLSNLLWDPATRSVSLVDFESAVDLRSGFPDRRDVRRVTHNPTRNVSAAWDEAAETAALAQVIRALYTGPAPSSRDDPRAEDQLHPFPSVLNRLLALTGESTSRLNRPSEGSLERFRARFAVVAHPTWESDRAAYLEQVRTMATTLPDVDDEKIDRLIRATIRWLVATDDYGQPRIPPSHAPRAWVMAIQDREHRDPDRAARLLRLLAQATPDPQTIIQAARLERWEPTAGLCAELDPTLMPAGAMRALRTEFPDLPWRTERRPLRDWRRNRAGRAPFLSDQWLAEYQRNARPLMEPRQHPSVVVQPLDDHDEPIADHAFIIRFDADGNVRSVARRWDETDALELAATIPDLRRLFALGQVDGLPADRATVGAVRQTIRPSRPPRNPDLEPAANWQARLGRRWLGRQDARGSVTRATIGMLAAPAYALTAAWRPAASTQARLASLRVLGVVVVVAALVGLGTDPLIASPDELLYLTAMAFIGVSVLFGSGARLWNRVVMGVFALAAFVVSCNVQDPVFAGGWGVGTGAMYRLVVPDLVEVLPCVVAASLFVAAVVRIRARTVGSTEEQRRSRRRVRNAAITFASLGLLVLVTGGLLLRSGTLDGGTTIAGRDIRFPDPVPAAWGSLLPDLFGPDRARREPPLTQGFEPQRPGTPAMGAVRLGPQGFTNPAAAEAALRSGRISSSPLRLDPGGIAFSPRPSTADTGSDQAETEVWATASLVNSGSQTIDDAGDQLYVLTMFDESLPLDGTPAWPRRVEIDLERHSDEGRRRSWIIAAQPVEVFDPRPTLALAPKASHDVYLRWRMPIRDEVHIVGFVQLRDAPRSWRAGTAEIRRRPLPIDRFESLTTRRFSFEFASEPELDATYYGQASEGP